MGALRNVVFGLAVVAVCAAFVGVGVAIKRTDKPIVKTDAGAQLRLERQDPAVGEDAVPVARQAGREVPRLGQGPPEGGDPARAPQPAESPPLEPKHAPDYRCGFSGSRTSPVPRETRHLRGTVFCVAEPTTIGMSVEIGSREQLMIDLTLALAPGSRERLLTVVRLHGLHAMTERSGTAARDQLLRRAHRLTLNEVRYCGRLYLPRRDELCVLFDTPLDEAIRVLDDVTRSPEQPRPDRRRHRRGGRGVAAGRGVPPDRRPRPGRPPHPPRRLRGTRGMARRPARPSRGAATGAAGRGSGAAAVPPHRLEPRRWLETSRTASARPREGAPRCVRVVVRARPERPRLHRVRNGEHSHALRPVGGAGTAATTPTDSSLRRSRSTAPNVRSPSSGRHRPAGERDGGTRRAHRQPLGLRSQRPELDPPAQHLRPTGRPGRKPASKTSGRERAPEAALRTRQRPAVGAAAAIARPVSGSPLAPRTARPSRDLDSPSRGPARLITTASAGKQRVRRFFMQGQSGSRSGVLQWVVVLVVGDPRRGGRPRPEPDSTPERRAEGPERGEAGVHARQRRRRARRHRHHLQGRRHRRPDHEPAGRRRSRGAEAGRVRLAEDRPLAGRRPRRTAEELPPHHRAARDDPALVGDDRAARPAHLPREDAQGQPDPAARRTEDELPGARPGDHEPADGDERLGSDPEHRRAHALQRHARQDRAGPEDVLQLRPDPRARAPAEELREPRRNVVGRLDPDRHPDRRADRDRLRAADDRAEPARARCRAGRRSAPRGS